ncbi:MAG: o-succinylbenzoate synthase [Candidatus Acidiferrales bacterium]
MKIEAITLREIRMPLIHYFETSFARTSVRRILLVTVHGDGIHGWGECSAGENPFYNEESVDTAWHVISEYLAPSLIGHNLERAIDALSLFPPIRGNNMAKSAVENALWDTEAIARAEALWKLIGGTRTEIPCGVSIGIQSSIEILLEKITESLAAGYQRIKIKVKPGWDTRPLQTIRNRWPDITLSCDANSAYRLSDFAHLKQLDDFRLLMLEQPLWHDDLYFHAQLQKEMKTSICLDESIQHARDAEAAIQMGSCRTINIKVGRVGGFSEATRVHDLCHSHHVPVWCGGMLESGIGRSHNIAICTLPNFVLPGDVSASKRYWHEDLIDPEVEVSSQGMIAVPNRPGRGFEVREKFVEEVTVRKEIIRTKSSSRTRT